ncbi:hypothetical protein SAMN04487989_1011166 [Bizionia echini]|uniref:Uncharacterized protein n=1 Tax=Bizionia echini TaxID=649333 RepID=A0A1I4ZXN7_9FLAO|nr:hypothetical protein [Bizionia echini]SFN54947.1 hypothetical protein SAMN04487989_1011166 [Bizionia echini]|tara:strand:+ start:811 stop:972 length:162 start_codon:yes stop_codon:yes gene_type:complete
MDYDNTQLKHKFVITEKGSLGLLAMGDIGLREWRKVKKAKKKEILNKEGNNNE